MSGSQDLDETDKSYHATSRKRWLIRLILSLLGIVCFGCLCGLAGYYISEGQKEIFTALVVAMETTGRGDHTKATLIRLTRFVRTDTPPSGEYFIGVGRSDVTGPVSQVNMMGYAKPGQNAGGLHTRLYSKAYVITDVTKASRVVFVSVDYGMTSQVVKLRVIKQLRELFGDIYTEQNVVISGSHTHSAPGGYFQYALYEATSKGTVSQATESYVTGIVESIKIAHENLRLGNISIASGELHDANINRSPSSYLRNPEEERKRYKYDTDQEMTVLRLDSADGNPLGLITWFPVHLTSMNSSNHLINSDNKGRASMLFEKMMRKEGEILTGQEVFVAAFAQGHLGDVSPNTAGPKCTNDGSQCDFNTSTCASPVGPRAQLCVASGPGVDMFDSTDIIGSKQFHAASGLYNSPKMARLTGHVTHAHQYVDMSKEEVELEGGAKVTTCKSALGYSFASGCTDGTGAFDFHQGMTEGTEFWERIRAILIPLACSGDLPTEEYGACHDPKPVLFPTGYMDLPYAWHPSIVDVQLLRVGQLILAAVPGEFSTMAGRRLKEAILEKGVEMGMPHDTKVVIAGLSNVYTHYMVTYEEYQAQRYEAASTLFGPYTHSAYMARFTKLMEYLVNGEKPNPGPTPHVPDNPIERLPAPNPDYVPPGFNFGDVINDANDTYMPGDTVKVKFYGANPRHNTRLGSTYLEIKKLNTGDTTWSTIHTDADWETKFIWEDVSANQRSDKEENVITSVIDMIAIATGWKLDLERARELYDLGQLAVTNNEGHGHINRHKSLQEAMIEKGVLKPYQPIRAEEGTTESHVTIEWDIPKSQSSGTYELVYHGDFLKDDVITPFTGTSKTFTVEREY